MATNKEFIVNKKFLIVFVAVQVILLGLFMYAMLSPKTVTIQVEKLNNSYQLKAPLDIEPLLP